MAGHAPGAPEGSSIYSSAIPSSALVWSRLRCHLFRYWEGTVPLGSFEHSPGTPALNKTYQICSVGFFNMENSMLPSPLPNALSSSGCELSGHTGNVLLARGQACVILEDPSSTLARQPYDATIPPWPLPPTWPLPSHLPRAGSGCPPRPPMNIPMTQWL